MSNATIARPYAKAVFELAQSKKKLADWSFVLKTLSELVLMSDVSAFLDNPQTTPDIRADFLFSLCQKSANKNIIEEVKSFIAVLAQKDRLALLPDLYVLFEDYKNEQEKTLVAQVSTFSAFSASQEKALIEKLSQKLSRQVNLEVTLEPNLLGGFIVKAGDKVFDMSVRGQLTELGRSLVA